MDNCPICNRPLINGGDGKQQIEYAEENLAKFNAGEISLAELNETAKIFYMRNKLCDDPSCINFAGDTQNPYKKISLTYEKNGKNVTEETNVANIDFNNPRIIVSQVKIYDN